MRARALFLMLAGVLAMGVLGPAAARALAFALNALDPGHPRPVPVRDDTAVRWDDGRMTPRGEPPLVPTWPHTFG